MSLLVVGSVALDSVHTPAGEVHDALGGSAVYFAVAARLFHPVSIVGVVGRDFPEEHIELLRGKGIDLTDLQVSDGETFRWAGQYHGDMSVAETLGTHLNVFADFQPELSAQSRLSEYVFLANIHPSLQMNVLEQASQAKIVLCDTMNLWLDNNLDEVKQLLKHVTGIILNDQEARTLAREANLVSAGKKILELGPQVVVIKKGEHGASLFFGEFVFPLPGYPLDHVVDPTGAGDSFAGGLMGYLARKGGSLTVNMLKRAVAYGIMTSSFCCEGFSLDRLREVTLPEVDRRLEAYRELLSF